jgi:hypothetical protein
MQDMDVRSLAAAFFETFDGSARADLARFMADFPLTRTWLISSDYVVGADDRPNDVFAFSIMPYVEELGAMRRRLSAGLPRDIKGTRAFTAAAGHILRGPDVFHVPVVLPKDRLLLGASGAMSVANGRKAGADFVRDAIGMERGIGTVKAMRKLERVTKTKGYNHRLLADVLLLALLFPALSIAVLRERRNARLSWMSDRDAMTQWADGALWHIAQLNLSGLAEAMFVELGDGRPGVCVPGADGSMWFDELVRLPDHMAGALSAWDMVADEPTPASKTELVSDMLREVFAGADNVAVIRLRSDSDGSGWSRVLFERR